MIPRYLRACCSLGGLLLSAALIVIAPRSTANGEKPGDPLPLTPVRRICDGYGFGELSWAPDQQIVASGQSRETCLRLWDVAKNRQIRKLEPQKAFAGEFINAIAWSPDGKTIAASRNSQNGAIVWDVKTGKVICQLDKELTRWDVYSLAWSPDGKKLASMHDHWICLYAIPSGKEVRRIRCYADAGCKLSWSPDGKLLAAGSSREGPMIWHVETGKEIFLENAGRTAEDNPDVWCADHVAWSPDGRTLAFSDYNKFYWYDPATGKQLHCYKEWRGDSVQGLAYSPDCRILGVACGDLLLFDSTTRKILKRNAAPKVDRIADKFGSIAFSPDGKQFATGMDKGIVLWKTPTLAPENINLTNKQLTALWSDLSSLEMPKMERAVNRMAAGGPQCASFLQAKLIVKVPDPALVCRLIGDLDSSSFSTRDQASKQLASFSDLAESALKKALTEKPSLEKRRRLDALLAKLPTWPTIPLQQWRALGVLERMASPEARKVLETLAAGPPCRLTEEAKGALSRVKKRLAMVSGK